MKKLLKLTFLASICIGALGAHADTIAEGQKLLDVAITHVSAVGRDAAARDFIAGGKWRVGSMYVVLNDMQGTVLAHSVNPKMVGKVMLEAKDAGGKAFVEECVNNLKATGKSVVALKWANPVTKKFDDATMLSRSVPGTDLYVSVLVFTSPHAT